MFRFVLVALYIIAFSGSPTWAQQEPDQQINQLVSAEYNMAVLATNKGLFTAYQNYSDENSVFFTPAPIPASIYLKNRPQIPDIITWKPVYAKVAKSDEWGFTTGPVSWQSVGSKKKYGEYFCLWKRDRKGEWKIAYRAISEHGAPTAHVKAILESPEDNRYRKSRSKARLKQRQDIILSTDQLFSTILKADNQTAFKEFLTDEARIYIPGYTPVIGIDKIRSFLNKQDFHIESTGSEVDRAYSGELAYSQGEATIRQGDKIIECYYIRAWELQEDSMWKVTVDMYFEK
ncbi:DUF4440 domain-containing protein [Olivibacter sp. XZL3]|uniref:DUF4440 domain-containing protein n=1 Tax=Olivibacter sp. XZL3 TaxID=1735116 RepID=UPI001417051B|nr:DUF4440 domain-containing protein [Olivibacter sp. XZL3]